MPGTTIRAAAFKVLKRTLISDQTLEPTQVAGFIQFYDDLNQVESWRYGLGLDQKLSDRLFAGAEFSARDLKVPATKITDSGELEETELDWHEYSSRVYLFSLLGEKVSLRGEYIYEQFQDDDFGPEQLINHRIPLGVRYFEPSGMGGFITATYLNQDGRFAGFYDPAQQKSGKDTFWLLDAGISYRLPNRLGFVSVGATNLTDQDFRYFEIDYDNPTVVPTRTLVMRLTLALP
jgi:opacity protein-like surface antigen